MNTWSEFRKLSRIFKYLEEWNHPILFFLGNQFLYKEITNVKTGKWWKRLQMTVIFKCYISLNFIYENTYTIKFRIEIIRKIIFWAPYIWMKVVVFQFSWIIEIFGSKLFNTFFILKLSHLANYRHKVWNSCIYLNDDNKNYSWACFADKKLFCVE